MRLRRRSHERKVARLEEEGRFFNRRRYLREDVTVFGEELGQLHVETLTEQLDEDARDYYRYALESYERAKAALSAAETAADLDAVVTAVVDGRHQHACVLALVAGEPLPAKLEECFFNPQHGPSSSRVSWTPPGGVQREVAVCASDAQRLRVGEQPKARMVRVGDRHVPLYSAGDPGVGYFPPVIDDVAVREGVRDGQARSVRYGGLAPDIPMVGGDLGGYDDGGGGGI